MSVLHVTTRSGRVRVTAEPGAPLRVEGGEVVTLPDGTIEIRGDSNRLDVQCASGTDIVAGTASGTIEMRGELGAVRISTFSGKVKVESATSLDVRTTSGRVQVERCHGECRVVAKSARVEIEHAGRADVATVSGRIEAEQVGGASVKSISGTIAIGTTPGAEVHVRSVSGRVGITVPKGCCPATRLASKAGSVRCDCPPGDDGELDVATMSGAIEVLCR